MKYYSRVEWKKKVRNYYKHLKSFGDSVVSCNICLYWYYIFLLNNSVNLPI